MIARLLNKLPSKVIGGECYAERGPLMTRWFLLRTPWLSIMIHRFHRSDFDRHFHDHPWAFLTCLLTRGYTEHTPSGVFWRRRFSILWRNPEWRHWVEIDRPLYTLVVKFRTVREWGFITPDGWVHWKDLNREAICND